MTLRSRFAAAWNAWTGKRPMGEVPDLAGWMLNHPFMPAVDFDNYVEAFKKVPIVQQCTRQIQHDVASLPLRIYQVTGQTRKEVERKDGNLVDLLAKANPRDSGYQFMSDTVGSRILAGNAYWFLQRAKSRPSGPPTELWSLPAQNVRVTPTEKRGVLLYEYNRGGLWEPMDPASIIHFRDYNPSDEPVGMSRIEPVRREFEAQFYALIWLREFFKKGGMISGLFVAKDASGIGPEQVKAIQASLVKLHQGYDKAFNPVVVDAALEYLKQGQTLTEMDLERNLSIINASIARSIGVPPMRLGIKEGGNAFNDGMAASDAQNYWFGTIGQETAQIASVITEKLAPLFGPNLVVEFDMRGVLPVQAAKLAQAKTVKELVGRPVLTVNEGRKMMGEEPIDDPAADELYEAPTPTFGVAANEKAPEAERPAAEKGPEKPPAQQARLDRSDPQTRDSLRRRKSADLARYERMVERHFRSRFVQQRPLVKEWLKDRAGALGVSGARVFKGITVMPSPIPIQLPDDEESLRRLLRTLLEQRGESALADIGVELQFNAASRRAADFIERMSDWTLTNVDETTITAIQGELALGIEQNETLAQIIGRIDTYFDMAEASRSALIGRTETTRAYNFAANEAWQQSGVVSQQEWLTARDGAGGRHAEDPIYAELDGQVVGLEEKFRVGNEWLAYPGDPDADPSETCNCRCFPGDTPVMAAGAQRVFGRLYRGRMTTIRTASGLEFSGTPNHPVLGEHGWVALGLLKKGDRIFRARASQQESLGDPDVQHEPTVFEQVFRAASVAGRGERMHGREMDFHGDGRQGEVEVVDVDRLLRNELDAEFTKPASEPCLALADHAQASLASDGLGEMCGMRERDATLPMGALHASEHPFAAVARNESGLVNAADDCGASYPETLGQRENGLATLEPMNDLSVGDMLAHASELHALLAEAAKDGVERDAFLVGKLSDACALSVEFDQVVNVETRDFLGHVYNLQTVTGWYIAGGIIAHNCTLMPAGIDEGLRRRLNEQVQWELFVGGPSRNGHESVCERVER